MDKDRGERQRYAPDEGMSKQDRVAVGRLRTELKSKGFISVDGSIIPKSTVNEIMAGLGYPADSAVGMATPAILGHAMGGQIEEFSADRENPNFYLLTKPKK